MTAVGDKNTGHRVPPAGGRSSFLRVALAAFFATCVALLGGLRPALADDPVPATLPPPRDVSLFVQPSTAKLPPLPADFERLEHGWLSLEFPASVRSRVEDLARDADSFRQHLSEELAQPPLGRVLVRVARTPEQMAELSPEGAPPPAYAAGVAYPSVGLALLTLRAPSTWEAPDAVELLRHELTHLALAEAVAGHHVPRWFNEGFAIHESGEFPWARRWTLAQATLGKRLLPFDELDYGFPADREAVNVAYAQSASVVAFLLRDADRARFGSLVERVRSGVPFDRALADAYGTDARKLEYEWRQQVEHHFSVIPAATGGAVVWVAISGLAVVAWLNRRRRTRAKLAQWAREEAEMEAALAAAEDARRTPAGPIAEDDLPAAPQPGIPVVEHEGRWYTVH